MFVEPEDFFEEGELYIVCIDHWLYSRSPSNKDILLQMNTLVMVSNTSRHKSNNKHKQPMSTTLLTSQGVEVSWPAGVIPVRHYKKVEL